jgi:hypothetical protein
MNREIKKEVKTYKVEMCCDKCDSGKMLPTGRSFLTHPMQYQHACDKCENTEDFRVIYPHITQE